MSHFILCGRKLTVLPWHPLRRIASRFAADLDENITGNLPLLGVSRGHHDLAASVAEFFDGVVGVGVVIEALDSVSQKLANAHDQSSW